MPIGSEKTLSEMTDEARKTRPRIDSHDRFLIENEFVFMPTQKCLCTNQTISNVCKQAGPWLIYPINRTIKVYPMIDKKTIASNHKGIDIFLKEKKIEMRKMIVTDLDGTLLRDDKSISYQTIELLNQWRTRGNLVVLATARPVRAVKSFVEDDIYDAGIYHNGAVIISGESYIAGCGIENINEVIKRLWLFNNQ